MGVDFVLVMVEVGVGESQRGGEGMMEGRVVIKGLGEVLNRMGETKMLKYVNDIVRYIFY